MLIHDVDAMVDERALANETAANYRRSVLFFGEFLTRPAVRDDLAPAPVNSWLATIAATRSAFTVLGHKRSITAVWNWLADQRLVPPYETRRLRRVKLNPPPPAAWSVDQVRALLAGCDAMPGRLRCGLPAGVMMRAWVLLGYETALRAGDLRRLRARDVSADRVAVVQHKTGRVHTCTLSPSALDAIAPLIACRAGTLFPVSRNTMRRWELRLFNASAAFGFVRRAGQGLGTLRKTSATEVCRRDGLEAASRVLGHVSGTAIARTYYVVADALGATPQPPALENALALALARSDRTGRPDSSRRTG